MRGSPPAWPLATPPERQAVDLETEEPTGPTILLLASGDGYVVTVAPALASGNHRREFYSKIDAWSYAQGLWCDLKIGFADHSTGNERRAATGPYRSRI